MRRATDHGLPDGALIVRKASLPEQMLLKADFQDSVAMDRHRETHPTARSTENVMTSLDSHQRPAVSLQ